jgi:hypothetical protein
MKAINLYRTGKLSSDLALIIQQTPHHIFSLPSEAYAENPLQLLRSIKNWPTGRAWETQHSLIEGVWVPWEQVYAKTNQGTHYFPNRIIAEVWANYGDDGHTRMLIVGHATIEWNPGERITYKAIDKTTYDLTWEKA